ncbi:hypothetical protein BD769DRAFT_1349712, partial [Suillus cothurnatus]
GTFLNQTGHLAYLLMQRCKDQRAVKVDGRRTRANKVTILEMPDIKFDATETSLAMRSRDGFHKNIALIPIATSVVTCIFCAWGDDWYCFSLILLGILINGISCFVIGSASIVLQSVASSKNAPPGDGLLMDGNHVIVLLGKEKNVLAITQGKFQLEYKDWVRKRVRKERRNRGIVGDGIHHRPITNTQRSGFCSVLLVIQFLTQLLLIPQGRLFGQVMFLASFAVSWAYNLFLSSMDKEYLQEELLAQALDLSENCMRTYKLGTRTACSCFRLPNPSTRLRPQEILRQFIPNDTHVWAVWRDQVLEQMKSKKSASQCFDLEACGDRIAAFNDVDKNLLSDLLMDARTAHQQYLILQVRKRNLIGSLSSSVKTEAW